ncbi:MAG: proton-conducting transporter membrane subunit [Candidatus Thermoplasmatota archaeon]
MNWFDNLLVHSPALVVATPLLAAFLTPLVSRIGDKARNIFVVVMIVVTSVVFGILGFDVLVHGPRIYIFGDSNLVLPVVRILFEVDAFSILFASIALLLAFVGSIYSLSFMKNQDGLDKYYTLLLLLLTSILGMVLTGDLFNFFVFLEISCIASCALIAFWVHRAEVFEAAFKYIVVSSIAALFVLFAIGLLYAQYNALNIATLANLLQYTYLDKITLVLFLGALALKAGLAPLHLWLPDSYGEAPPSITIVIMGATMASVYGVLRICFTLYGSVFTTITPQTSIIVGWFIIALAVITIILGIFMALRQRDLMRLIAFAAVGEIGYIFIGVGVRLASATIDTANNISYPAYSVVALQGSIFHIFNDILDIGLLFLVAGAIYYVTKKRTLDDLQGLAHHMKFSTVFFIIGLFAVSGMPPFNGFDSKLMLYESTFQLNPILAIIEILFSILLLAVFVKVFYAVFMGPKPQTHEVLREVPKSMLVAMGFFAGLIIFIGVFPEFFLETIIQPAAHALLNHTQYITTVLGGM